MKILHVSCWKEDSPWFNDFWSHQNYFGKLFLFTALFHYFLLLFVELFTQIFRLFKGGCPLGVQQVKFSSDFSSLRTSLLRERTHPTSTTTTLFTLVHYKLCNSTNLVTRTSSSFVTVDLYCWDLVFTTTISVYPTFNNKYFQFYVHFSICCYRYLGQITAITEGSKFLSFTLNYFHIYLAGSTAL